jgi:hypothetical protein
MTRFKQDMEAQKQLSQTVKLSDMKSEDFDIIIFHRVIYQGEPLVKGKRVTGFTNGEEAAMNLTHVVPLLVERRAEENRRPYVDAFLTWWQQRLSGPPRVDAVTVDALELDGRATHTIVAGQDVVATGWALAGPATPLQAGITIDGLETTAVRSFYDPLLFTANMVGSTRGTGLRNNVANGQVGRWDRHDRQAHRDDYRDGADVQVPKFRREGNADPGSGRPREVSAGCHVSASGSIV